MSTDRDAILDPTGRSRSPKSTMELAARPADLRGVRVGLLENTKHNADLFLDELGRLLLDEHEAAGLFRHTKKAFALPVSEDELAGIAAHCDVVITGVGDCGSCSASAVADGVAFERHGIPAAVICSDAYRITADAMAGHAGMPGYRYVTTPHPIAVLTPDEVRERARQSLKEIVTLITAAADQTPHPPTAPQGTVTQPSHTHPTNRTPSRNATTAVNPGEADLCTSGPAPLIVVNGPVRTELGFNSAGGVFGPGFRPNATVARAIGLIVRNVFGVLPQVFEQATQGVPGRWSICLAENEDESPWGPLSADGGLPAGTSAVSAMLTRTCEFVDNRHTSDPEQLLADFADTISPVRRADLPGHVVLRGVRPGARPTARRCRLHQGRRAGLAGGALRPDHRRPAAGRQGRHRRERRALRGRIPRRRRVPAHPAGSATRPGTRGRRPQRRHVHGGPGVRDLVRRVGGGGKE